MSSPSDFVDTGDIVALCRTGDAIDQALLREMIVLFVDDTRHRIEAAIAALDSGERDTLRREVHAIKGSAAVVGAARLRQLAGTIEAGVLAGQAASLRGDIETLYREFNSVVGALRALHPEAWTS